MPVNEPERTTRSRRSRRSSPSSRAVRSRTRASDGCGRGRSTQRSARPPGGRWHRSPRSDGGRFAATRRSAAASWAPRSRIASSSGCSRSRSCSCSASASLADTGDQSTAEHRAATPGSPASSRARSPTRPQHTRGWASGRSRSSSALVVLLYQTSALLRSVRAVTALAWRMPVRPRAAARARHPPLPRRGCSPSCSRREPPRLSGRALSFPLDLLAALAHLRRAPGAVARALVVAPATRGERLARPPSRLDPLRHRHRPDRPLQRARSSSPGWPSARRPTGCSASRPGCSSASSSSAARSSSRRRSTPSCGRADGVHSRDDPRGRRARRAAHPPRRLGRLRHPLEPRPRAGHRAAGARTTGSSTRSSPSPIRTACRGSTSSTRSTTGRSSSSPRRSRSSAPSTARSAVRTARSGSRRSSCASTR